MDAYNAFAKNGCLNTENLEVKQDLVVDVIVEEGSVKGVVTELGNRYYAKAVILTPELFKRPYPILESLKRRQGDSANLYKGLSEKLKELGLEVGRLKTGNILESTQKA